MQVTIETGKRPQAADLLALPVPELDPAGGRLPPEGNAGIRNGRNGFGRDGYGGPCPPPGDGPHHYEFTLNALDGSVGLEPGATIDDLRSAIDGHIRATATLMGIYQR